MAFGLTKTMTLLFVLNTDVDWAGDKTTIKALVEEHFSLEED